MFRLVCEVQPGVFSNEILIHFSDASGEKQSAFVDREAVLGDSVLVRGTTEGDTVLVSLPGDGSRYRVPASLVEATSRG